MVTHTASTDMMGGIQLPQVGQGRSVHIPGRAHGACPWNPREPAGSWRQLCGDKRVGHPRSHRRLILQPVRELEPATQARAATSPGLLDEDCLPGGTSPTGAEGSWRSGCPRFCLLPVSLNNINLDLWPPLHIDYVSAHSPFVK